MPNRTVAIPVGGWPGGWNWIDDEPLIQQGDLAEVRNLEIGPAGSLVARRRWTDPGVQYTIAASASNQVWACVNAGVLTRRGNDPDWAWFSMRFDNGIGGVNHQTVYWANNSTKGNLTWNGGGGSYNGNNIAAITDSFQWEFKMYAVTSDIVNNNLPDVAGKWDSKSTVSQLGFLTDASLAYNNNYAAPVGGKFIYGWTCCEHNGYAFVGYTREGAGPTYNRHRIRFSHPNQPEDWASADFIDIFEGGEEITAIRSLGDHLVIFKDRSVWALHGYDKDTWQVVNLTTDFGTYSPSSVCEGDGGGALYFANEKGVFRYDGRRITDVSVKINRYFKGGNFVTVDMQWNAGQSKWIPLTINHPWKGLDAKLSQWEMHLQWVRGKLWVSCPHPWTFNRAIGHPDTSIGASVKGAGWTLVYDPDLGAWTTYRGRDHCGVFKPVFVRKTQWVNDGGHSAGGNTGDRWFAFNGSWPKLMIVEDPDWERWEHIYGTAGTGNGPRFWFRTPWMTGDIPTLKKRWRRADIICAGRAPNIDWASMTDFETWNHRYGTFSSPLIAQGATSGAADYGVARTSSFGNAVALSVLIHSQDPAFAAPVANKINVGEEFRVSGIVLKHTPRRLR